MQAKHPHLGESRMRIRHHQKDAYEYVFGAMIYCLKVGDDETAELLKTHLDCVDGGNDCELCGREHREYLALVQSEELEAVA